MKSLVLNLMIAVVWLLLSRSPSPAVFAIGLLMGFGLLAVFPDLLASRDYVRRSFGAARFLLVFIREFLLANISVAALVLFRPRSTLHPDFVTYDTSDLRPYEILLLSYCVSLTPGSTSVEISEDFNSLVIHALDAHDPAALRRSLDEGLKHSILAFTR
jgi:multisubunit Na+/H+ antiporter MnhE subunit